MCWFVCPCGSEALRAPLCSVAVVDVVRCSRFCSPIWECSAVRGITDNQFFRIPSVISTPASPLEAPPFCFTAPDRTTRKLDSGRVQRSWSTCSRAARRLSATRAPSSPSSTICSKSEGSDSGSARRPRLWPILFWGASSHFILLGRGFTLHMEKYAPHTEKYAPFIPCPTAMAVLALPPLIFYDRACGIADFPRCSCRLFFATSPTRRFSSSLSSGLSRKSFALLSPAW